MDMGLTKGTEVHVRKVAPLGDPIEITVRGSRAVESARARPRKRGRRGLGSAYPPQPSRHPRSPPTHTTQSGPWACRHAQSAGVSQDPRCASLRARFTSKGHSCEHTDCSCRQPQLRQDDALQPHNRRERLCGQLARRHGREEASTPQGRPRRDCHRPPGHLLAVALLSRRGLLARLPGQRPPRRGREPGGRHRYRAQPLPHHPAARAGPPHGGGPQHVRPRAQERRQGRPRQALGALWLPGGRGLGPARGGRRQAGRHSQEGCRRQDRPGARRALFGPGGEGPAAGGAGCGARRRPPGPSAGTPSKRSRATKPPSRSSASRLPSAPRSRPS